MQNIERDTQLGRQSASRQSYHERLSPSLWTLVSAALVGPMIALVFAPVDTTLALVIGALAGLGVVALLVAGSPVIQVSDGRLRAGRARIDERWLGDVVALTGEDARLARGARLHARAWHVIRGGIDGVVVVAIEDPDDPAPEWVLSTRTPDRLAAALGARRGDAASA